MRGREAPKARPLAVETPTRRPVYEPGPLLTQTASQSETASDRASRTSLTRGAVREACMRGSLHTRSANTRPPSAMATDRVGPEVSINSIFAMLYRSYHFLGGFCHRGKDLFEEGEYQVGKIAEDGVEHRLRQNLAFSNQLKALVKGVEHRCKKPQD